MSAKMKKLNITLEQKLDVIEHCEPIFVVCKHLPGVEVLQ
jgi:hypothetical protein